MVYGYGEEYSKLTKEIKHYTKSEVIKVIETRKIKVFQQLISHNTLFNSGWKLLGKRGCEVQSELSIFVNSIPEKVEAM